MLMSNYLSMSLVRERHEQALGSQPSLKENTALTEEVKALEQAALKNPTDVEARLTLAAALKQEAERLSDPNLVMRSVETYQEILAIDENNHQALLALAGISHSYGVLPRAKEYYERYIAIHPENLAVRSDFALLTMQNGEIESAISMLQAILKEDETSIPARVTLAFAYRQEKKKELALKEVKLALSYAKDDETKARVQKALDAIKSDSLEPLMSENQPTEPPDIISPAARITSYFQQHSIVGPKFVRMNWKDSAAVEIFLKDFPVEQMPPFAREKFLGNIRNEFSVLPDKVTIQLVDSRTKRELLSVSVGGEKGGGK